MGMIGLMLLWGGIGNSQESPRFKGVVLKAKLIGGGKYELLYEKFIPQWEKKTGAKVVILSKKQHFALDREIKKDIAAGTLNWDIASNHISFAAQYPDIYIDLYKYVSKKELASFFPRVIKACTIGGRLIQMPRHGDIRNLYYRKSIYERYGFTPPDTWDEFKEQAIKLTNPPNFYGTVIVGKEEALTGTFYEILMANGGSLFDENWKPTFDSPAGQKSLGILVDLYQSHAVPPGSINYLWDDTANAFASGTVASDYDWGGWGPFFNNPKTSKVAGDVWTKRFGRGDGGIYSGWSGCHTFSVTKTSKHKEAAVDLVKFLTSYEASLFQAETIGYAPQREDVWKKVLADARVSGDNYTYHKLKVWYTSFKEDAFPVPFIPEWISISDIIYPELQAAMLGKKTIKEALGDAKEKTYELMKEAGYYRKGVRKYEKPTEW
ncbi:MAG: extracellular solute-binding protein [Deltaproteobacteria bacterium]|nr:extracellular solute-binding protein [Deltaproteobacteria bacterium]